MGKFENLSYVREFHVFVRFVREPGSPETCWLLIELYQIHKAAGGECLRMRDPLDGPTYREDPSLGLARTRCVITAPPVTKDAVLERQMRMIG